MGCILKKGKKWEGDHSAEVVVREALEGPEQALSYSEEQKFVTVIEIVAESATVGVVEFGFEMLAVVELI